MKTMNFFDKCLEKKNYVSVSRNTHKQKQLILSNLNELYANFKSKYVSPSIGFSIFCELQPMFWLNNFVLIQCVFVHMTQKFLLAPPNVTYQEPFPLIVCDINNKECMVHRYSNCFELNTVLQDFFVQYYWRF